MRIPEKVRIAIDLIYYLRHLPDGSPRRGEDLAPMLGTSTTGLHQVTSKLSKAGLIAVIKGPKGGMMASVNQTSLLDLYILFGHLPEEIEGNSFSIEIEKNLRKYLSTVAV